MRASAAACVRHLVAEYRSFLRTSYRFLDPALREQFERHLGEAEVVVKGPFVSLSRDFLPGPRLDELIERGEAEAELGRARWAFGDDPLFAHQARSLAAGRAGRSFVVTTGTGSGKTESFLLPVLDGIVRRKREGVRGVQAVLLYPMNALANDQLERLRRLLRGSGLDVSFALWTGDSDTVATALHEEPAETERTRKEEIRGNPPDILLTNYKQLEFLLVRKRDRVLFTPALRFLVLDELHSYRGALATEIACLVRRLKAHAGLEPGSLVGIGTSATVGSGDAREGLASFASVLFGEEFRPEEIFLEELVPLPDEGSTWVPPAPDLGQQDLLELDSTDEEEVVRLAQRLTGRPCTDQGPIAERIGTVLRGNALVRAIEEAFAKPASLEEAVSAVKAAVPTRAGLPDEALRLEIEAYLVLGSIGDDSAAPRLRPKLHTFFHGIYDVWLCIDPACRTLVPQGGGTCTRCGGKALPAALCRTCGQDFVKVTFTGDDDAQPIGTGDFYSDPATGFLTPRIHPLPAAKDEEEDESEAAAEEPEKRKGRRKSEEKLVPIRLCTRCGRILAADMNSCPDCAQSPAPYLLHRGPLNKCPACGDVYTRGDIVTPLRTGTASTVSTLTTHHLDKLEGDDRKVLVFADNRQDVAHQAGYTTDKHRVFALRHLLARIVRDAGAEGKHLSELPQILLDEYRKLGIIRGKPTKPERDQWLQALQYECANEVTRYTRQRASLENLGLVAVDYEFLEELDAHPTFQRTVEAARISTADGRVLARILLDVMRKNRAVAFGFFQEFLDPDKRRYRLLEECGVRFPDRDRAPKGYALDRPDHIRKARAGSVIGFYQENPKAGQLTAIQKVAVRVLGDRARAERFLRELVPILEELEILVRVPEFPIPARERVASLRVLQIDPKVIRLAAPQGGFRCNACQAWCAFDSPTCPTPRCTEGRLAASRLDEENYYVRLYRDREPRRLRVEEHSAQVSAEDRAKRETEFKDGKIDALVCSPTLELGVDIGPLLTVVLRNAPPTPANYVQRVGRAGRRLRIGFVSTFCAGGAHDRHAFEDPLWLISGRFTPPRVRLDNQRVVDRHLRSFLLEHVEAELPQLMKDFLDDLKTPTRWLPERLSDLHREVADRKEALVERLATLFDRDRDRGRTVFYSEEHCRQLVEALERELTGVLDAWWQRVRQLDKEHREFSTIGSPRQDERKASARKRAYYEITQDPERAYTLNYLSTQGLLPAYQFPLDTFSLDPGVQDTQTIYRSASIALDEFAPGNYVYANGHKLRSIRVLFAGGPGRVSPGGRSDAETSGRLQSFQFCDTCGEVAEAGRNACGRCGSALGEAKDCIFVDAFEAEESLRIGSDEESRQRVFFGRRENLLASQAAECWLHRYPLAPVEHRRLATLLVTNWGPVAKRGQPKGFWLCLDCGRHRLGDPGQASDADRIRSWDGNHARYCSGTPQNVILGYKYQSDCLVLSIPAPLDEREEAGRTLSPTLVTLAEALTIGAGVVLELEPGEIAAFPQRSRADSATSEIVFYETIPGGAGYVEEMAKRLPEVARAAAERLFGHECRTACYLCLKRYHNQYWHPFFNKQLVLDLLRNLSSMDAAEKAAAPLGSAVRALEAELPEQRRSIESSRRPPGTSGPQSPIEALLLSALRRQPGLPEPVAQYEITKEDGRTLTIPDFAFPDKRIAIYCDGYAYHGNPETLALDAKKRNLLQSRGWIVLTYWGRAITQDADACAREIASVHSARGRTSLSGS